MKRFLHSIALLFSMVFVTLLLIVQTGKVFSQPVLPVPDHIVVAIFENHAYSQIIGSPVAPYINSLASDTNAALFIQSYAIEHPSQPSSRFSFEAYGCEPALIKDIGFFGRQLVVGTCFGPQVEIIPEPALDLVFMPGSNDFEIVCVVFMFMLFHPIGEYTKIVISLITQNEVKL